MTTMLRIFIFSNFVLILAMKPPNLPSSSSQQPITRRQSTLNPNASDYIPARKTSNHGHQNTSTKPSVMQTSHTRERSTRERLSPETIEIRNLLPNAPFDFDPEDWPLEKEETSVKEIEPMGQRGSSSSSDIKIMDETQENSEKSSSSSPNIAHLNSPATTAPSAVSDQQDKGEKSRGFKADKDEAELEANLTKISLEMDNLLEGREPSEQRQQKPEAASIESIEKDTLNKLIFGSVSSYTHESGLTGVEHHCTPIKKADETDEHQQKDQQPSFVEIIKKPTSTKVLTNIDQNMKKQQSSPSTAQGERKLLMSSTSGKAGANVQDQASHRQHHSSAQRKEQQSHHHQKPTKSQSLERKTFLPEEKYVTPAKRGIEQTAKLLPKNLPSSPSPTVNSPVVSSPFFSGATFHSSKTLEKQAELKEEKQSQRVERASESYDKNIDQQKGSKAQEISSKKEKKNKKAITDDNKLNKEKAIEEKRELDKYIKEASMKRMQMEQNSKRLMKQQFEAALQQSRSERKKVALKCRTPIKPISENDIARNPTDDAKAVEQKLLLVAYFNGIVDQLNDVQMVQEKCQQIESPDDIEQGLHVLKSSYQDFMKLLENFALEFGDKFGRPLSPYTFFVDILLLFQPILVGKEERVKEMMVIVLDCLFYLDQNGGLAYLKEQNNQPMILDKLLQNIFKLDELITLTTFEQSEIVKLGIQAVHTVHKARRNVQDWYHQNVHYDLRETIGYLYVGVKELIGESKENIDRAIQCLKKFAVVLPHRQQQIEHAVKTISKLFEQKPRSQLFSDNTSKSWPSTGSSSSRPPNIIAIDKGESKTLKEFDVEPKTPKKVVEPKKRKEFDIIVENATPEQHKLIADIVAKFL